MFFKRISSLSLPAIIVLICAAKTASFSAQNRSRFQLPSSILPNVTEFFNSVQIDPIESALEYLEKFGWVEPRDWVKVSPRINETAEEVILQLWPVERVSDEANHSESHELSEETLSAALRNFQQANQMSVTGRLDENTLLKMTQPRCGVPDQTKEDPNFQETVIENFDLLYNSSNSTERSVKPIEITYEAASGESLNESEQQSMQGLIQRLPTPEIINRKKRSLPEISNHSLHRNASLLNSHEEETNYSQDEKKVLPILEGELDNYSRLENMEKVLVALKNEQLPTTSTSDETSNSESLHQEVDAYQLPSPNSLLHRLKEAASLSGELLRHKRSDLFTNFKGYGFGMAFAKRRITWRLVREWPPSRDTLMTTESIWATVKLAFRMWSEIIPREFQEDNVSPASLVDILIGFGESIHNNCPVRFKDGLFFSEYAHAWPLPKSEIHFNSAKPFVSIYRQGTGDVFYRGRHWQPISLLKVAVHEIGHALGLPHINDLSSSMNSLLLPIHTGNIVELGALDRRYIERIYGTCEISFDAVFDWVREEVNDAGHISLRFNTFIFRNSWYWLYDNSVGRPRYGDPLVTMPFWKGVLSQNRRRIDSVVQVRSLAYQNVRTFFFTGDVYVEYSNTETVAMTHDSENNPYPRRIADGFPGIPYPIDAVFFHQRENLLYFFKDMAVYRFSVNRSRVVDVSLISRAFPGWGGAAPLANNIDAAFYSYSYRAYFFFKGSYYWKLADYRERFYNPNIVIPYNAVGPKRRISSKWKNVCDVGLTELILNFPHGRRP